MRLPVGSSSFELGCEEEEGSCPEAPRTACFHMVSELSLALDTKLTVEHSVLSVSLSLSLSHTHTRAQCIKWDSCSQIPKKGFVFRFPPLNVYMWHFLNRGLGFFNWENYCWNSDSLKLRWRHVLAFDQRWERIRTLVLSFDSENQFVGWAQFCGSTGVPQHSCSSKGRLRLPFSLLWLAWRTDENWRL